MQYKYDWTVLLFLVRGILPYCFVSLLYLRSRISLCAIPTNMSLNPTATGIIYQQFPLLHQLRAKSVMFLLCNNVAYYLCYPYLYALHYARGFHTLCVPIWCWLLKIFVIFIDPAIRTFLCQHCIDCDLKSMIYKWSQKLLSKLLLFRLEEKHTKYYVSVINKHYLLVE